MRSDSGSRTCSIIARIFRRRARASRSVWTRSTSSIWRPTGTTGLSAVIGSWKIIAMRVARNCRKRAVARFEQFLADQLDAAAGRHQRALRQQSHHGQRGHRFARAALADQAQRLALADLKRQPSMMRLPPGFLPRPTTRSLMSRMVLVMSKSLAVIASERDRSGIAVIPGDVSVELRLLRDQTRRSRDSGLVLARHRNDGFNSLKPSLRPPRLLHARIEARRARHLRSD